MNLIKKMLKKVLTPTQIEFLIKSKRAITALLFYQGNKYACPCCNKSFGKFRYAKPVEFSANKSSKISYNILCPFCDSAPRNRSEAYILQNKIVPLSVTSKVLLFAPNDCDKLWFKRNGIDFVTSDFLRPEFDLKLDIQNIDLPDNSYDLVVANHILEHVSDYEKAMDELARIIKPTSSGGGGGNTSFCAA